MVDLPMNIVLPSSNRNRISSTGRGRGGQSYLRRGGCMDWGIGWQSDLAPHRHSTSIHPVMGSEQLESSEHSDF
jgi:hypothetical protein